MSRVFEPVQPSGSAQQPVLEDPASLIRFCDAVLPTLRNEDGLYCFDRSWALAELRGRSARYTLMVALGMARASSTGYQTSADPAELTNRLMASDIEMSSGDRGLLLWLLSRVGDDRAEQLLVELSKIEPASLVELEGMEIAWLVIGAAVAVQQGLAANDLLVSLLGVLWSRQAQSTPLFHHKGTRRGRSLLPNFATQIYSLLALAEIHRATNDTKALAEATRLADLLIASRDGDGGWPWLFHAEKGEVVERYQIYSVHQDAMAPMAYFALGEVSGESSYTRAGAEGLRWCFGNNELGFDFYDAPNLFAHRAIKKAGLADRAELWSNTAASLLGRSARLDFGSAVVNDTCRPYHLGWVLEAWAGRERNIELIGATV